MADIETRETELRAFGINKEQLQSTLLHLGATSIGHFEFKRAVLDVKPFDPQKWIRVRTDGKTTTLAIKQRISGEANGTGEIEVETADFDTTLTLLKELNGYVPRSIQENRRDAYLLDNVEVSLDTWPKLGDIVEIEADNEMAIRVTASRLGIAPEDLTSTSVEDYYLNNLGIDVRTTSIQF